MRNLNEEPLGKDFIENGSFILTMRNLNTQVGNERQFRFIVLY